MSEHTRDALHLILQIDNERLKLQEANALLEWRRYRYHEQVKASAYQERVIQGLQAEVDRLKRK